MIKFDGIYILVLLTIGVFMFFDTFNKHVNNYLKLLLLFYISCCVVVEHRILHEEIKNSFHLVVLLSVLIIILGKLIRDNGEYIISQNAIKEGFDKMGDGVCFFGEGGTPYLVNESLNRLSEITFNSQITNVNEFYNNILKGNENVTVLRKSPLNVKICDHVYNFTINTHVIEGEKILELDVYDVNEQYLLNLNLKEKKARADLLNKKLKRFDKDVERLVSQEEVLNARVRVHDDVGRVLLSIRSYFALDDDKKDRKKIVPFFKYVVSILLRKGDWISDINSIYVESDRLKVKLHLNGDFPNDETIKDIFKTAILECLNNGVKHSNCKNLYCDITDLKIVISNDGFIDSSKVIEKGGLKNLRTLVENNGGVMKIECDRVFKLIIDFGGKYGKEKGNDS